MPALGSPQPLGVAGAARRLILLAIAAAWAGLVLGACGDQHGNLDLFAHFRWQYAGVFSVGAVLLALIGRPFGMIGALLGLIFCLASLGPSGGPAAANPASIKLISANIWAGNQDLSALLGLVKREQPDVLILIELTRDHIDQLASLNQGYAQRLLLPLGHFGIGIWTNLADATLDFERLGADQYSALTLTTQVDGQPLWLLAAHPVPPLGSRNQARREQEQHDLLALIKRDPRRTVLIGDLNATPWSSAYRDWQAAGLSAGDHWPTPTWSPGEGWGRILGLPIDHALAGDSWSVWERQVGEPIGSDHRPLMVEIAPRH